MPDTEIYSFFLDQGPGNPGIFLFKQKFNVSQRPQVGQVVIKELTFEQFKVIRDEIPLDAQQAVRITDNDFVRVTDQGEIRTTGDRAGLDERTHNYFITPSNDPNRIASWTTNTFDDDRTLDQLFR